MGPSSINKLSHNMAHTLTEERKEAPKNAARGKRHEPHSATRTTCVKAMRTIDGVYKQHVEKDWEICIAFGRKMSQDRGLLRGR